MISHAYNIIQKRISQTKEGDANGPAGAMVATFAKFVYIRKPPKEAKYSHSDHYTKHVAIL